MDARSDHLSESSSPTNQAWGGRYGRDGENEEPCREGTGAGYVNVLNDTMERGKGMARFLFDQSFGSGSDHDAFHAEHGFAKRVPDVVYVFPDPLATSTRHLGKSFSDVQNEQAAAKKLQKRKAQYTGFLAREACWKGQFLDCLNVKFGPDHRLTLNGLKQRLWHPRLANIHLAREKTAYITPSHSRECNDAASSAAGSSSAPEDGERPVSFEEALKTSIDMFIRVLDHTGIETTPIRFGDGLLAIAVEWQDRDMMLDFAESMYYPVPLDAAKIGVVLEIPSGADAYVPYRRSLEKYLKRPFEDMDPALAMASGKFLTSKDRALLTESFIAQQFSTQSWRHMGLLVDAYVPHHKWNLVTLQKSISWDIKDLLSCNLVPITHMHKYFGPRISMYFAFVELMVRFAFLVLMLQVLFRWPCYKVLIPLFKLDTEAVDYVRIADCILLCLAGKVFTKAWCRCRERLLLSFGVDQVESLIEPPLNPKLVGTLGRSELDVKDIVVVPHPCWRCLGRLCAILCDMLFFAAVTLIMHIHFFVMLSPDDKRMVNLALIVQVRFTKWVWHLLSPYITNLEQWNFIHEYDENLEFRQFYAIYLNAILPFVYVSYVIPMRQVSEDRKWADFCLRDWNQVDDVCNSLMLAEMGLILVDVIRPITRAITKGWRNTGHLSFLEHQYLLPDYDGLTESSDYQEIIVPFWYMLLYAQASGCTAVLFLVFICVSQRLVDIWKVLHVYRRPMPQLIRTIGARRINLLGFVSFVSSITNWSLLCLYCKPFINWGWQARAILFLTGSCCLMMLTRLIDLFFKDRPPDVNLQSRQCRHQRHVCMDKDKVQARAVRFDRGIGSKQGPGYERVVKAGTLPEDHDYFEDNLLEEDITAGGMSLSVSGHISRFLSTSPRGGLAQELESRRRCPRNESWHKAWLHNTVHAVSHPMETFAAAGDSLTHPRRAAHNVAHFGIAAARGTADMVHAGLHRMLSPIESGASDEGSEALMSPKSAEEPERIKTRLHKVEEDVISVMLNSKVPRREHSVRSGSSGPTSSVSTRQEDIFQCNRRSTPPPDTFTTNWSDYPLSSDSLGASTDAERNGTAHRAKQKVANALSALKRAAPKSCGCKSSAIMTRP